MTSFIKLGDDHQAPDQSPLADNADTSSTSLLTTSPPSPHAPASQRSEPLLVSPSKSASEPVVTSHPLARPASVSSIGASRRFQLFSDDSSDDLVTTYLSGKTPTPHDRLSLDAHAKAESGGTPSPKLGLLLGVFVPCLQTLLVTSSIPSPLLLPPIPPQHSLSCPLNHWVPDSVLK